MEYFKEDESYESRIAKVYVIEKDDRTKGKTDYEVLNTVDPNRFSDIAYEMSKSVEEAAEKAEEDETSVLLVIDWKESGYQLNVLLPEETELNKKDTDAYEAFLLSNFRYILMQKSDLEGTQIAELTMPIETVVRDSGVPAEESDEYSGGEGNSGKSSAVSEYHGPLLYDSCVWTGNGECRDHREDVEAYGSVPGVCEAGGDAAWQGVCNGGERNLADICMDRRSVRRVCAGHPFYENGESGNGYGIDPAGGFLW